MPLYHIQDGDRPMYVIALSWQGALTAWQNIVARENKGTLPFEHDPQGISFIADDADIIITAEETE